MLNIPERGFHRSVEKHNVDLDVLSDWIEATVLFDETALSVTDIVDVLHEENIYESQDMASERIGDAWAEMRRRQECAEGASPFSIRTSRIARQRPWQGAIVYSFCLLLSLAKWYRTWSAQFGQDYTEQGELFEEVTKESLKAQFTGWEIVRTGWGPNDPKKLKKVVDLVADHLGECKGDVDRWSKAHAKEAGLDILCYRPFPDRRVGIPVFLLQCASGADWDEKTSQPRIEIWRKIVQFAAMPKKAFATPFALLDDDFPNYSNLVDGMLLDRSRLLAASTKSSQWLSEPLSQRIVGWANPRVEKLPLRAG